MMRKTSPSQPLRSHHRVRTNVPLESRVERLQGRVLSQDVSLGGMALLLPRDAKVGDHLHFELELGDGGTCTLDGEVCRVDDVGVPAMHKVGLRWVHLTSDQLSALDRYCGDLRAAHDRAGVRGPTVL